MARDRRSHRGQRALRRLPVAGLAGQSRVGREGGGDGGPARRGGVVGRVGRARDQLRRIVRGVVEATGTIAEPGQGGVEQGLGEGEPAPLPGELVDGAERLRHAAVVVQHPGRLANHTVPGDSP